MDEVKELSVDQAGATELPIEEAVSLQPVDTTATKMKTAGGYLLAAMTLAGGLMAVVSLFIKLDPGQSDAITKSLILLLNLLLIYLKVKLD